MAQVYNIMNRLTNDKPIIKIDKDHEYTVNNSKNSAILIKSLTEDPSLDEFKMMDKIIEAGLGGEALSYINSLELSLKSYATVMNAIMAAISDESLEEIEKAADQEMKRSKINKKK
ncbi:hypothetical protein [Clostridium algidicarnis]|uniref:hypothetical protein n=1 Tax=Clostridium algidicarnis TaxID=37659 RepID=UPI001627B90C|nr:hypothetical protein [Clostridium algidicarnis]MBB6696246.1 hypothetical protein [Clostridium algidicarnis]MBU3205571.1 hypothetical protein [Clostridium algidicarnis]